MWTILVVIMLGDSHGVSVTSQQVGAYQSRATCLLLAKQIAGAERFAFNPSYSDGIRVITAQCVQVKEKP